MDNGIWSPRAFLQFNIVFNEKERKLIENMGTEDYPYTWQVYYFKVKEGEEPTVDDLIGPYTASMQTYYAFPNSDKIIYRLAVGECPEGHFVKELEVGESYGFYIRIKRGIRIMGDLLLYQKWEKQHSDSVDVYYNFWENHDRSLCITSGIHIPTDEDCAYAESKGFVMDAKPVIYLYPEAPTEVSVQLDVNGELVFTYPKYNDGWSVTAYPDGTLIDKATGKEYSYLFWDAYCHTDYDMTKGFVVKGEDIAEFLQETLAKIGLTPREYNEMIVYWLPLMENNKYNLITFQTEVYTENAKLYIAPEPDSLLRVFMAFKPLDEPIEVEEPEFEAFERRGFTVVEWGGAKVG